MKTKHQAQANRYLLAHLRLLEGRRIKSVELVDTGELAIPTLTLDNGNFVQVWCDPEGNGPGHLGHYDGTTGNELSPTREALDAALG